MRQATLLQRFAAFAIDMIVFFIVFAIFSHILQTIIEIPELTDNLINLMSDNLKEEYQKDSTYFILQVYNNESLLNDYNTWMNLIDVKEYYTSYYKAFYTTIGLELLFMFIECFLYFVLLPCFFKYQTLGRLFTKTKVVSTDSLDMYFGSYFRREIVGGFILHLFDSILFLPSLINVISICSKNKSIGDKVGHTMLVRYDLGEKKHE